MGIKHSIIGLSEVLKWMEARGHDRCQLLKDTGINVDRLSNAKDTVSPTEELQFYRNLVETSTSPHILLEIGRASCRERVYAPV